MATRARESIRNAPVTELAITEFTPRTAEPANIQAGEVAADHAAEIGGEKRQPGEHGDLLQIHAVLFRRYSGTQKLSTAQAGSAIKAGMAIP